MISFSRLPTCGLSLARLLQSILRKWQIGMRLCHRVPTCDEEHRSCGQKTYRSSFTFQSSESITFLFSHDMLQHYSVCSCTCTWALLTSGHWKHLRHSLAPPLWVKHSRGEQSVQGSTWLTNWWFLEEVHVASCNYCSQYIKAWHRLRFTETGHCVTKSSAYHNYPTSPWPPSATRPYYLPLRQYWTRCYNHFCQTNMCLSLNPCSISGSIVCGCLHRPCWKTETQLRQMIVGVTMWNGPQKFHRITYTSIWFSRFSKSLKVKHYRLYQ